jgi:hypothetical protein
MESGQYKLSFTGASLSLAESIKIAEVYLDLRDWEAVEHKVKITLFCNPFYRY